MSRISAKPLPKMLFQKTSRSRNIVIPPSNGASLHHIFQIGAVVKSSARFVGFDSTRGRGHRAAKAFGTCGHPNRRSPPRGGPVTCEAENLKRSCHPDDS